MAIKKNAARQELIVAHLDIGYADITAYGTAEEAFDLPGNAILLGGDVVVKTAWNSATTATLASQAASLNSGGREAQVTTADLLGALSVMPSLHACDRRNVLRRRPGDWPCSCGARSRDAS